jgi:hypothetical protein
MSCKGTEWTDYLGDEIRSNMCTIYKVLRIKKKELSYSGLSIDIQGYFSSSDKTCHFFDAFL